MSRGTCIKIRNFRDNGMRIITLREDGTGKKLDFFQSDDLTPEQFALYDLCRVNDRLDCEDGVIIKNVTLERYYPLWFGDLPESLKHRIVALSARAYVKYVCPNPTYIKAHSPIFNDITVKTNGDTMGCRRGDEIKIKGKYNDYHLVENVTLNREIGRLEYEKLTTLFPKFEPILDKEQQSDYDFFVQWHKEFLEKRR